MITMVWVNWFLINIFDVVVLLNFLIAFISETYEEVYAEERVAKYTNMANLNVEYQELFKPFIYVRMKIGLPLAYIFILFISLPMLLVTNLVCCPFILLS